MVIRVVREGRPPAPGCPVAGGHHARDRGSPAEIASELDSKRGGRARRGPAPRRRAAWRAGRAGAGWGISLSPWGQGRRGFWLRREGRWRRGGRREGRGCAAACGGQARCRHRRGGSAAVGLLCRGHAAGACRGNLWEWRRGPVARAVWRCGGGAGFLVTTKSQEVASIIS